MDYLIAAGQGVGVGSIFSLPIAYALLLSRRMLAHSRSSSARLVILLSRIVVLGCAFAAAMWLTVTLAPAPTGLVPSEFSPLHLAVLCGLVPMGAAAHWARSMAGRK